MPSPPKDLSRHFSHEQILASADITVKGVLPELALCPFCHNESLAIYMDPIIGGASRWLHCRICQFHGDTLEVLAKIEGTETLHEAINVGVQAGFADVPLDGLEPSDIAGYIQHYPERRNKIDEMWGIFQKSLLERPSPELVKRVQGEHMWGGWRSGYQSRITQFLGGGTRAEVSRTLTRLTSENVRIPRKGFSTVLVLAYQDVPGRICAFDFMGENQNRILKRFGGGLGIKDIEGGLGMLDALNPFEPIVYAVGEQAMAMQLHRRQFATFHEPLKLVLFNDKTSKAWQSVHADKIILWDRELSWKIFDHARRIPNHKRAAYISTKPSYGRETHLYVFEEPLNDLLSLMNRYALPWAEVFVKWLTSTKMPASNARAAVAKLNFDASERKHIYDYCPQEMRPRLAHYMDESSLTTVVYINRNNVVETEGGWWVSYPMRGKELICDAPIKVFKEITDPDQGVVYWEGEISYKNQKIDFMERVEVIEKSPLKWLRKRAAEAGLGLPMLQSRWIPQFIHLAKIFSEPKQVVISSKLGPDSSGSIRFPRFRLMNGKVEGGEGFVAITDTPAMKVRPPVERSIARVERPTPLRAAFVACACAFVANWLHRLRDMPVFPVALIGGSQSVSRVSGKSFAEAAGMLEDNTRRVRSKHEIDQIRQNLRDDYPSYIETDVSGSLSRYPTLNADFVYLAVSAAEAAAFASGGHWVMINAPQLSLPGELLPPFDDVLLYLLDLQRRDYDLPDGTYVFDSVLIDYCAWYGRYVKSDQEELYNLARKMSYIPLYAGKHLIELACFMHQSGKLPVDHGSFIETLKEQGKLEAQRFGILIDDTAERVFISQPSLKNAVDRSRLPMPEFAEATRDLLSRKQLTELDSPVEGWILEKEYWEQCVKDWRKG